MSDIIIGGTLHSAATGNIVARADELLDRVKGKKQNVINQETEEAISSLQLAVGTGGSVDARIDNAVNAEKTRAQGVEATHNNRINNLESAVGEGGNLDERINSAVNIERLRAQGVEADHDERIDVLEESVGSGSVNERISNAVNIEKLRAENAEELLRRAYEAITRSKPEIVADHTEVVEPEENTIYREFGESSYSDWMYYNGQWYKMATYDNAIDDEPTTDSDNLVKSGGVAKALNNLPTDVSNNLSSDFSIGDEQGNEIVQFKRGHINTKKFDSSKTATIEGGNYDLSISDEQENEIVQFKNGHIKTKNFDSETIDINSVKVTNDNDDFSISDENANKIVQFKNGHIKTKNFDSENITDIGAFPQINQGEICYVDTEVEPLRIVTFGSSFMNQAVGCLPYILAASRVNAEIYNFKKDGGRFYDWLHPVSLGRPSRLYAEKSVLESDPRYISREINLVSNYWKVQHGVVYDKDNNNSDDTFLFNDFIEDISVLKAIHDIKPHLVIFMNGATAQRDWSSYKDDMMIMIEQVKRMCPSYTYIGYHMSWTPAAYDTSKWSKGDGVIGRNYDLSPYTTDIEGQRKWMEDIVSCTKKFVERSGLKDFVPNGTIIWNWRHLDNISDIENRLIGAHEYINNTNKNARGLDWTMDGMHLMKGVPCVLAALGIIGTYITRFTRKDLSDFDIPGRCYNPGFGIRGTGGYKAFCVPQNNPTYSPSLDDVSKSFPKENLINLVKYSLANRLTIKDVVYSSDIITNNNY